MLIYAYGNNIISYSTCYRWYKIFEKGDFNLEKLIPTKPNKERVIEELVRLILENPRMTQAMMAAKVGVCECTVFKYLKSEEFQNKLKEKEQEQSSIPLERTTSKALKRKLTVEKLVRLRLENPRMTQAMMAAKVGMCKDTVFRYLKSEEFQNELKVLQQDQSSIPPERTTLKRQHRELEDEKLVSLSQDELAKQLEMSLPTTSKGVNTQRIQNKLKQKGLEPSTILKKRRISRTPSTESEDEELEHFIDEFPGVTPEELAKVHGISISQAERIIDPSKIENE
ncbi:PREDICTED: uncharacterized protein LOC107071835 isoform X1 [Polistes dominula]|uniref:Uncharacterized protein LOC107071835 isoform X1 n=2 Tax=Polistes dominula TaxID=743375 RepID=A0ABM1J2G2_POLDO|nr:PREDICTED: uncharacterized protein LOC107071835 isoform X1 [Polistes dominula]